MGDVLDDSLEVSDEEDLVVELGVCVGVGFYDSEEGVLFDVEAHAVVDGDQEAVLVAQVALVWGGEVAVIS